MSWQSYKPKDGDLVILDEFGRLPLWREFEVDERALAEFQEWIFHEDGTRTALLAKLGTLRDMMKASEIGKNLVKWLTERGELKSDWEWAKGEIAKWAMKGEVRDWIFGNKSKKPKGLWRFEILANILLGKTCGSVWMEKGKLKVRYLDSKLEEMMRKAAGILILDATVAPEEVEGLLGTKPLLLTSDDDILYPKTIQVPVGVLTHRASEKRKELQIRMAKHVVDALRMRKLIPQEAKVGVLTHKSAASIAQKIFGEDAVIGWWGRDDRATNAFYDAGVRVLVVVGLPHRNLKAIQAEMGKQDSNRKVLRLAPLSSDGSCYTILREYHDWDLAEKVRYEVACAYLQAAGRLRQNLRKEQCYMIVCDTEPLPEDLSPQVIKPNDILPQDVWTEWTLMQRRGAAKATEVAAKVKQAKRVAKLAEVFKATQFYRQVMGEEPPTEWLTKVTGIERHTLRRWNKLEHSICVKDSRKGDSISPLQEWIAPFCFTELSDYRQAIELFKQYGYPVPVRGISRRIGVPVASVSRYAKKVGAAVIRRRDNFSRGGDKQV